MTINLGNSANKITLFYKTQRDADKGLPWFDALANKAVQFVARELSDLKGMMANMPSNTSPKSQVNALEVSPRCWLS